MITVLSTDTVRMSDQEFNTRLTEYKKYFQSLRNRHQNILLKLDFINTNCIGTSVEDANPEVVRRIDDMLKLCTDEWLPTQLIVNIRSNPKHIVVQHLLVQALNKRTRPVSLIFDFSRQTRRFLNNWMQGLGSTQYILQHLTFIPGDQLEINLSGNYSSTFLPAHVDIDSDNYLFKHLHRAPAGFILNIDDCILDEDGPYFWQMMEQAIKNGIVPNDFTLLARRSTISEYSLQSMRTLFANRLPKACQVDLGTIQGVNLPDPVRLGPDLKGQALILVNSLQHYKIARFLFYYDLLRKKIPDVLSLHILSFLVVDCRDTHYLNAPRFGPREILHARPEKNIHEEAQSAYAQYLNLQYIFLVCASSAAICMLINGVFCLTLFASLYLGLAFLETGLALIAFAGAVTGHEKLSQYCRNDYTHFIIAGLLAVALCLFILAATSGLLATAIAWLPAEGIIGFITIAVFAILSLAVLCLTVAEALSIPAAFVMGCYLAFNQPKDPAPIIEANNNSIDQINAYT